jgi:two-component system sensor histidine kinase BaeS
VFPKGGARELARISGSAAALQSRLIKEEELRSQWASDVAHDLRTPVSAVKAQIEAMIDGVLDPSPERLKRAFSELSRIEDLVNDLGELSRIESPGMKLTAAEIRAESFMSDMCSRFTLEAEKRGIAFSCSSRVSAFHADEKLLMRALTNVVQNAFQHAGDKGSVSVLLGEEAARPADAASVRGQFHARILLTVENTGRIPEEEIPKVFDRLYRGELGRHTKGSGLGLTIARAVMELHGGDIAIRNTARETTEVTMRLSSMLPA